MVEREISQVHTVLLEHANCRSDNNHNYAKVGPPRGHLFTDHGGYDGSYDECQGVGHWDRQCQV